ncbi:deoxyribodipyrimidine photo-lyase [Microvirga sp. STR05]|uniref:Deoxyribodipyrimidine photo-lyase n=1 Tax=Hymenobacter duratus TaxID=2771356 RepID=A0ABR8JKM7_9BACT|nr:deoxyribodipyrimidine photo-lyase [Hymenobacter duratus]MBD2715074.1 deoxyribodipyrimidine photo-lyase [Hymenobacter duratus]MBR7949980.1 deoxyribodipyrimidine photo-lyase [Microvirga sp. STR05]
MATISLFWHRRDLRFEDNVGLAAALQAEHPVVPLFIFDPEILDKLENRQDARVTFIYDEVERLRQEAKAAGGSFLVRYGHPVQVMQQLLKELDVAAVYTNHDYEQYAATREAAVKKLLDQHSVAFHTFKDQVIFEKDELLTKGGLPYKIYGPYKRSWLARLTEQDYQASPSASHLEKLAAVKAGHHPTLQELGFERSQEPFPDRKLTQHTLEHYAATRDLPARDSTSRLGLHLRFGTVSIRKLVQRALAAHSDIWLSELIWRDFFMQLLWHFPHTATQSYDPKLRDIRWRNNEAEFQAWCAGRTGFPLIDAGMRQLNATGFMHNRVRMAAASFLIKNLLIDWRWGEAYFAEKLLDYEMASNVGNWQWVAGTGADSQPWFRVFSPDAQLAKFDKQHAYVKQWVPEFGTARYPAPIVEPAASRDRALAAYRASRERHS